MLRGETVAELIVGVPLRPDGREDAQAQAFREFGESLAVSLGAVCIPQNERFSSESLSLTAPIQRERGKARAAGRKSSQRARRERERSHAEAAARILQRWIDARDGAQARSLADADSIS